MKAVNILVAFLLTIYIREGANAMEQIPKIPSSFEEGAIKLGLQDYLRRWKLMITFSSEDSLNVPKTIISPSPMHLSNFIPQDVQNPLYRKEYSDLSAEILLDGLSAEFLSLDDVSSEGINIKTFSGKEILVKKDESSGKILVNGVPIRKHEILEDGTLVVTISGYLFDHRTKTMEALNKFMTQQSNDSMYSFA